MNIILKINTLKEKKKDIQTFNKNKLNYTWSGLRQQDIQYSNELQQCVVNEQLSQIYGPRIDDDNLWQQPLVFSKWWRSQT